MDRNETPKSATSIYGVLICRHVIMRSWRLPLRFQGSSFCGPSKVFDSVKKKLNISFPDIVCQKLMEVDDELKLHTSYESASPQK